MDTRPIGIFDSGLGGLTAVKELERLLPNEEIVYFGDTGRVPYGSKSRDTIIKYTLQDIRFLKYFNVKAIIIACNTASSVAYNAAVSAFDLPIIGVVDPTTRAAVGKTRTGRIGVIGTNATIASGVYERTIKKLYPQAQIRSRACPLFVPLVENGCFERGNRIAQVAAHEYLDEFKGEIDTLILGCTHYPLLRGVIEDILPDVALIDSGFETAKVAAQLLSENDMLTGAGSKGGSRFYVSDSAEDFARLAGIFLEHTVTDKVEKVEIDKF